MARAARRREETNQAAARIWRQLTALMTAAAAIARVMVPPVVDLTPAIYVIYATENAAIPAPRNCDLRDAQRRHPR